MAQPVALYGLEIPPGDVLIPASPDFPATFRITMAAIDPTEAPEADNDGNIPAVPRSTLRLVKQRFGDDLEDDGDDEIDEEYMKALIAANDDDEDSDDDDEPNGGPSDPAKSKKQKQADALKKLIEAAQEEEDSDEEMDDAKPNGKSKKGKAKASDDDEDEESEEDSDDEDGLDLENFVICTLDTERNYQQPIDITVTEGEKVFFVVSGTHTVHLTGNYVIDAEEGSDSEDEDDEDGEYDLSPDELEYAMGEVSDEDSDDLDDTADPRVMEVDSDDEEAPKLVETKKGKNKRAAESLDDLIAESKDESKLSKKDKKKLKNNKGEAVAAEEKSTPKSDKKVQFAKNLEQGPTGSAEKAKQAGKVGVKVVQGVTIDDRKVGSGRAVKNGDTVGVRYIGKLDDGKVFDANKKGKPFSFKAGKGQVIKGWDVGILGMTIGGERRLTIPAHLAYGSKGLPGIPANSTLTFDVKLLEIK
ncbi:FKBP-type peptidyl-prolyl cis-trans isomerase [Colletotrichum gloeosporioides Cg-14]|uniref:FK506-binding protein n=1 Tax=Colletotrichum gloeosporioides (strain Cg-14) TaxID=1237896 RepID=T0K0V2_COLGC|nr:FKBP-type peptidyl-prolyl cis-trans isomerase [Colletotrichum gloeosporioides Cg-14]